MFDSNKKIVYTDMLEEYHRQISSRAGGGGNQVDTIPTASSSYENKIVQYIGDTDSTYTNGYFYKCIEDPDNAGEYIWVNEQVQDGGSSGGGHEIEDSSGTSLTQRDTLQFAGDFEVSDDSTNEKTVVAPHELTNEDMAEIMSTLPTPVKHGVKYSLQEQVIGEWIDGKPVYQKTLVKTNISISANTTTKVIIDNGADGAELVTAFGARDQSETIPTTAQYYSMYPVIENNNFCLNVYRNGGAFTISNVTITYIYTKTTDTP